MLGRGVRGGGGGLLIREGATLFIGTARNMPSWGRPASIPMTLLWLFRFGGHRNQDIAAVVVVVIGAVAAVAVSVAVIVAVVVVAVAAAVVVVVVVVSSSTLSEGTCEPQL